MRIQISSPTIKCLLLQGWRKGDAVGSILVLQSVMNLNNPTAVVIRRPLFMVHFLVVSRCLSSGVKPKTWFITLT